MTDYVLFLQGIRENCPQIILWIMVGISEFVVTLAPIVASYILFCVDKSKGSFIALNFGTGHLINSVVKMTFCEYRPWVKDSRIKLASQVTSSSGGYSLPSGHTTGAMNFYGSIAILKNKKRWWIAASVLVLLTGFSRNFLGAHTLLDVLVAIFENIILLFISFNIYKYINKHEDKDIYLYLILFAIGVTSVAYILLKTYPMDYLADGTLLVDPATMINSSMKDAGMFFGIITGWIIMRRFGNFKVEGSLKTRNIRFLIGVLPTALMFFFLDDLLCMFIDEKWGYFLGRCISFLWFLGIYSVILAKYQKRKNIVD